LLTGVEVTGNRASVQTWAQANIAAAQKAALGARQEDSRQSSDNKVRGREVGLGDEEARGSCSRGAAKGLRAVT
jgi:hypothetical protein